MARVKNATFTGAAPSEVDVDSPTWKRVIKNAIGDLALVFDKVTGENAEASTINHGGTRGRGARLGVPWVNQAFSGRDDRAGLWGVDLTYYNPGAVGAKAGTAVDTMIFATPVFIPPGETDMTVVVTGKGLDVWPWRVELHKESDYSLLFQGDLTRRAHGSGLFDELRIETRDNGTDGDGMLCLLLIFADTTTRLTPEDNAPDGQIRCYSLFAGPTRRRLAISSSSPVSRLAQDDYNITTSSDRQVWYDFDSTLFADRTPLHAVLTGRASRNLNGRIEAITGWPVGGNTNYSLIDSADTNPTSAFMAHTQSEYANEPRIAWPLFSQCFGAYQGGGNLVIDTTPPTQGLLDWYGLIPIATAVSRHVGWRMFMPDFDTATSNLKVCVVAGSADPGVGGEGAKWSASWDFGSATASTATAFARVGTTALMTSKQTAVDFPPDAEAGTVDLRLQKSAAKVNVDEIVILGACAYFEP